MTTFNTDYNNTELLDQELTTAELSQVSGGCMGEVENEPPNPLMLIYPTDPNSTKNIDPSQQVNHQPYPQDQYIVRHISVVANL